MSMQARQARNLLSTYCISNYGDTDMSETQCQPLERACMLLKCHGVEGESLSDIRQMQTAANRSHKSMLPSEDSQGYQIHHV